MRLREGLHGALRRHFQNEWRELLWEPLPSLCAGLKCVPSSLDLVMALQLSREQGITLRGSAEIVAEFFCKSSRRPQGEEN